MRGRWHTALPVERRLAVDARTTGPQRGRAAGEPVERLLHLLRLKSAALVFLMSLASCIFCIDDFRIVSTFFRSRGSSWAICEGLSASSRATFCISACCAGVGQRRMAVFSDLMHCWMISSSRFSSIDDSLVSVSAVGAGGGGMSIEEEVSAAPPGRTPLKSIRSCSQSSACSKSRASVGGSVLSAVSRGDSRGLL